MRRLTSCKHHSRILSIAIALAAVTGCLTEPTGPITALPRALTAHEENLIEAVNNYAFQLMHAVRNEMPLSNVILSPLSTAMSLAMLYNGADGTTREAMADALGLQLLTLEDVNTAYHDLISLILDLDPTVRTNLANAILYRPDRPLSSHFVRTVQDFYDADVLAVDFRQATARQTIDDWVASATDEAITSIAPDAFEENEILVGLNAIHLDAEWTYGFDTQATELRPFYNAQGTRQMVLSMSHATWEDLRFYSDEVDGPMIAVEMPYGREALSMTILQPKRGDNFALFSQALDARRWRVIAAGLQNGRVDVTMPMFGIENALDLRSTLTAMGMGTAFDSANADFSRLRDEGDLFLSGFRHSALIDVDESGTRASAATSVTGGEVTSLDRYDFVVDRPFLFIIRERLTGAILFVGQVVDLT